MNFRQGKFCISILNRCQKQIRVLDFLIPSFVIIRQNILQKIVKTASNCQNSQKWTKCIKKIDLYNLMCYNIYAFEFRDFYERS